MRCIDIYFRLVIIMIYKRLYNREGRMKKKKATLEDVAREAGVSICTVSRVIHNKGYISENTRKRVKEAIRKLNYRQDMIARSLKTNSTDTIGFIVTDLSNPFFSVMSKGIDRIISKKEYSLLVCNTDSNPSKEMKYLDLLLQKRVDGIILASCGGTEEKIKEVVDEGTPIVLVDNYIEGFSLDSVTVDNFMGAYKLTSHLLQLGHIRIGLISGPLSESSARERLDGYKSALTDHGIDFDSKLVTVGDFRLKSGYRNTLELLSIIPSPTAIFATNNFMALGALSALKQKGLRVPSDLALVGFDMVEIASVVSPSITTMAYSPGRIGILAARLLLEKIEGGDGKTQNLLLKPRLLIRESCGYHLFLDHKEKLIEKSLF